MKFLKKHWSSLLILVFIILLIVPKTRLPIQVFINQQLSFDPDIIESDNQFVEDYQWPLQTLSGETVNFSRSKGNVVVVNLWATWCAPCIAEMPDFQALYTDYGERVDFYFVSSDRKKNLEHFMLKNNYTFPVFSPLRNAPNAFEGKVLPTTYLIDKAGKIVIKETGTAEWNSKSMRQTLDRLLNARVSESKDKGRLD